MSNKNNSFFEKKKDWSITKDSILGSYLTPYFFKLFKYGRPICYIDCFAGKGKFDDGNDGSPYIAIDCIESDLLKSKVNSKLVKGYFIELNYSNELDENITTKSPSFPTKVIGGRFEDNIDKILKDHERDTLFLYIDPYGIKALDVDKFNSFKTSQSKSVELLINFNTWGFFREACRVLKVEFKLDRETAEYLVEYDPSNNVSREELNVIAGGDYWAQIILDYKNGILDNQKAEQALAKGISESFQRKYQYVLNVPVKSNPSNKTPKYRLFHLTNHEDGCLLMADIMFKRLNEANERQRGGQISLFDSTVEGDFENPTQIKQNLLSLINQNEIHLKVLQCRYFTKFGINTQASKISDILVELADANKVNIRRNPQVTAKGKASTFMTEKNDKKDKKEVFIKAIM